MFDIQYLRFIKLFEVYGILPCENNIISELFPILWLLTSPLYIWWGVEIDMISVHWIKSLFDWMYFLNYVLMFLTEICVLVNSIYHAKIHKEIIKTLTNLDEKLSHIAKIDYETSKSENATKIGFLIFYTICSMSVIIFYYIDSFGDVIEWIPTMIVSHMIHIKVLSFCFFVEILNERLHYILKALRLPLKVEHYKSIMKIHNEIYTASRLIYQSHGFIITIIIAVSCCSSINGIYCLFLKLSKLHPEYGFLDICYGTMSDGVMIFVICHTCTKLEKINKSCIGELHNLAGRTQDISSKLETFSIKSIKQRIHMNGLGALNLHNSLIVEILALTVPFLIFIIQFEIFFDEEK